MFQAWTDLVLYEYGSPADSILRHQSANNRLHERATGLSIEDGHM